MGENSKIEWTHHTFNPWIGCTKISAGCTNCYASVSTFTRYKRSKGIELWGPKAQRHKTSEDNWKEPIRWNRKAQKEGTRYRVFCASLADVFEGHENPETDALMQLWRVELFALIDATPWLDWILLTKRPGNIRTMWPGGYRQNVWLMTSVEDQAAADSRIGDLLDCADLAPVLGLSCEPMVGLVNLKLFEGVILQHKMDQLAKGKGPTTGLHWVIGGGESGHGARPMDPLWIRFLRDQCAGAGIPFLFKQWGEYGLNWDYDNEDKKVPGTERMERMGKTNAGRKLDGTEWNQFPTPGIPVEK